MNPLTARVPAALLAFFSSVPALLPAPRPAARRAANEPQIILSSPEIVLGNVTPDDPPDQPRFLQEVSILSDQPWTLQLLANDLTSPQTISRFSAQQVFWRLRGDRFRPLASNLPITLSTRPPTGPEPTTLIVEFAVQTDWTFPPGNYTGPLTFVLNSAPVGSSQPTYLQVAAPVRLTVAPYGTLRILGSTMGSPTVDPMRPDSYPYQPISVLIRSNTAWSLSAQPLDDFANEKGSSRLATGILSVVTSPDTAEKSLKREVPNLLASGGPSGNSGVEILVRLKTRLAGGEAAGQYRLALRLTLSLSRSRSATS